MTFQPEQQPPNLPSCSTPNPTYSLHYCRYLFYYLRIFTSASPLMRYLWRRDLSLKSNNGSYMSFYFRHDASVAFDRIPIASEGLAMCVLNISLAHDTIETRRHSMERSFAPPLLLFYFFLPESKDSSKNGNRITNPLSICCRYCLLWSANQSRLTFHELCSSMSGEVSKEIKAGLNNQVCLPSAPNSFSNLTPDKNLIHLETSYAISIKCKYSS
jgi:hypothetical protein